MEPNRKKVAAAAVHSLKGALTALFWYKSDLRSFLTNCLSNPNILSQLNWDDYKRNIVATLLDYLVSHEDRCQVDLLMLMTEVSKVSDFTHLRQLEDGKAKEARAREAVEALKKQTKGHIQLIKDRENIEKRREEAHAQMLQIQEVKKSLESTNKEYLFLITSTEPQKRGYRLEKILRNLFDLFDLDPKASFRLVGEQIDGAFSFAGTDYLLEAKWQADPVGATEIDSLSGKLSRKLDNTLGLCLSINGYSSDAVKAVSSGRRLVILMDGSDLTAVLEGRIDLVQLLMRKKRAAAETGNIYLKIDEIIG